MNIAQRRGAKISVAMKSFVILVLVLSMLANYSVYAQQIIKEEKRVILIDAGHGGIDSGAVSQDGLQEKDVVLDIARSIIAWNKGLLEAKYDIYLTRSTDTLISLDDRTKLAKHLKPDVFVSLHCNHSNDFRVKGIELYTYGSNELSLLYAETISNELNQKLGFKIREVKQADFQVLRETKGFCPAILLELGYLSNVHESDYLKSKEKRKAMALAILMAI